MSSSPRFIHLRVHSEYSLLEGAMRVKKLPGLAAGMDMPAVALTDSNNMFAALEFSEGAAKAGVQPIIGCQVDLQCGKSPAPVVLLAQSEAGYENLLKLNTYLYVDKDGAQPEVTLDQLTSHAEGLICLSGGPDGPVARHIRAGHTDRAEALLKSLSEEFSDRLYVELQRHPEAGGFPEAEIATERGLIELAYALDLPLVATNDVYFPKSEMFEAHDALLCIAQGAYVDQQADRRRLTDQHYFKSPEEMATLFADLPEALENTVEIAQRCAFKAYKRDPILPKFADDEVQELRRQANEGLQARLAVIPHAATLEEYQERLDFELDIIEGMGFPGYFLIVADFIKWAKDHDIPVGPGRGSGAGSLVAYALTITDLDPLRYALLFERFLNPERVSMPDFDIDFCMDRREEVIRYVQEKYGRDKVGQIITFGALLSKAAVRDVGRVLQMPYGQVDRLSKMIPVEGVKPVSIEKALKDEPRLAEEARREEVVDRLLKYGMQVEGLLRNASTHAAGVVIGDRPLDALVPLYQDPRSDMPATQFNMKWVEQAGLVKFDFLGLKTLTVIQNAVELILKSGRPLHVAADGTQLYEPKSGTENDINAIPLDDEASYKLYASAKTVAVFQVESSGMMDALRRMKPTCIEDIIALVALYRPGPMENIPKYCEVKNGLSDREKLHPSIDHILDETQGIIVYQEQVMQIAQELAGYSLGEADLLRRAMGKKKPEEMAKQKERFMTGAAEQGVDPGQADHIFELVAKFAGYGFNKSHAAAYALVAYQTAWLKAHYPTEFYAASMQFDMSLTDKLGMFLEDARKSGIACLPPDINASTEKFTVERTEDGKAVRYALAALKGVGTKAMQGVAEEREKAGPYKSLSDFANRVDPKLLNKRQIETLASAGAFDALEANRAAVHAMAGSILAAAAAAAEARITQQGALFGGGGAGGGEISLMRATNVERWSLADIMAGERDAFGFYFASHPLSAWQHVLDARGARSFARCCELGGPPGGGREQVTLGALVEGMRWQTPQKGGDKYLLATMSDETGQFMVSAFDSEVQESIQEAASEGEPMLLSAELRWSPGEDTPRVSARGVLKLKDLAAGGRARLAITAEESALQPLKTLFEAAPGQGCVTLHIRLLSGGVAVLDLGENVAVDSELAHQAGGVHGVASVSLSA